MIQVPAIELNIVEHCNLRCEDCDHSAGLIPPKTVSPKECRRDLCALALALHARELKVGGGEPLLHPGLAEVLEVCRQSKIADRIVLWTNGLLIDRLTPACWSRLDGVVVSIYPNTQHLRDLSYLQPLLDRYSVWLHKRHCPEFVRGNTVSLIGNQALVQHIYDGCGEAHYGEGFTVREGSFFKCVQAAYATIRLAACGINFESDRQDGVKIADNPQLAAELRAYIDSRRPLMACRYCLGDLGCWHPHRQISSCQPSQSSGGGDPQELLSPDIMLPNSILDGSSRGRR